MKIYTRTGDDGTTGLYFGGRVPKDSARPMAYGEVDELQAALGLARAAATEELGAMLLDIQADLWVLMAELATAEENAHKLTDGETRVTTAMVTRLEGLIDEVSELFEPPTEFVVPGGSEIGARLDLARTVCRRAERASLSVATAPAQVVAYLNRLSDLCWTLARWQDGESMTVRSLRTD